MTQHGVLHLERSNRRAPAEHSKDSPHSKVRQEEEHPRIVRTARRPRESGFLRPTGAAFAASWFVGRGTGGAGGNVGVAAGWERATLKVTEGISLLQGLSPGRRRHFVKG